MQWECNDCAATENLWAPCVYENPFSGDVDRPKCPISTEDCGFEPIEDTKEGD